MKLSKLAFLAVLMLMVAACGGRSSGKSPKKAVGGIGQPCNFDGKCNGMLVCVGDRCENPPDNNDNVVVNADPNNQNIVVINADPNIGPNLDPNNQNVNLRDPFCGDGIQDPGEECDSGDLAGTVCQDFGFDGGPLTCTVGCLFDTSNCFNDTAAVCGNNVREGGEECDGFDIPASCQDLGYVAGELSCTFDCFYDVTDCTDVACGNGIREGGEVCDGLDLNGADCTTFGFTGGQLRCNGACADYDTSMCTSEMCGNGIVEGAEECDLNNLNGLTCADLGFVSGNLSCDFDCTYNITNCAGGLVCADVENDADCTDSSAATCECNGCVDNGVCVSADGTEIDDCVCADCAGDSECNMGCDLDGICNPFSEDCNCADCAAHPRCTP